MSARHILAAFGLLLAPSVALAAEVDAFFGDWRGVEVSVDGGGRSLELSATDLAMSISGQDGGFRIRSFELVRAPGGGLVLRPLDATFAPTGTPGVFAYEPADGSLLSKLFTDPAVGNPLEGDTLLWARLLDDALHVYSLAIDARGGFALAHATARLTQDGIATRYVLRLENEQFVTIEGRLERAGD